MTDGKVSKVSKSKRKRQRQFKTAQALSALEKSSETGPSESQNAGDSEGTCKRDESGLTAVEAAKMEGRAIRRGWVQLPFQTRTTRTALKEEIKANGGEPTLVQKTVLSVFQGLDSRDLRRKGIAERNAISMESHNLAVEQHADKMERGIEPPPQQINVSVTTNVAVAMEEIKSLSREDLERLAQASEIVEKVRGQQPASE